MTDNISQIVAIGMQTSILEVLLKAVPVFIFVFAAFYGFKYIFRNVTKSTDTIYDSNNSGRLVDMMAEQLEADKASGNYAYIYKDNEGYSVDKDGKRWYEDEKWDKIGNLENT